MLLACKYEEVSVPVVGDLILISDKAYTRKEILEMVIQFVMFILNGFFFYLFKYIVLIEVLFPSLNKLAGELDPQHIAV